MASKRKRAIAIRCKEKENARVGINAPIITMASRGLTTAKTKSSIKMIESPGRGRFPGTETAEAVDAQAHREVGIAEADLAHEAGILQGLKER